MDMMEFMKHIRGFRWWRCPVFKVWIPADISREEEIKLLEEAREYFRRQLEQVEKRLDELRK
ncbi:MAG TPA: hypothetical protein ENF96_00065 [Archaeoglobus veneficus]|nr:hypothetical protein [Archaeoglobus veneficus]